MLSRTTTRSRTSSRLLLTACLLLGGQAMKTDEIDQDQVVAQQRLLQLEEKLEKFDVKWPDDHPAPILPQELTDPCKRFNFFRISEDEEFNKEALGKELEDNSDEKKKEDPLLWAYKKKFVHLRELKGFADQINEEIFRRFDQIKEQTKMSSKDWIYDVDGKIIERFREQGSERLLEKKAKTKDKILELKKELSEKQLKMIDEYRKYLSDLQEGPQDHCYKEDVVLIKKMVIDFVQELEKKTTAWDQYTKHLQSSKSSMPTIVQKEERKKLLEICVDLNREIDEMNERTKKLQQVEKLLNATFEIKDWNRNWKFWAMCIFSPLGAGYLSSCIYDSLKNLGAVEGPMERKLIGVLAGILALAVVVCYRGKFNVVEKKKSSSLVS